MVLVVRVVTVVRTIRVIKVVSVVRLSGWSSWSGWSPCLGWSGWSRWSRWSRSLRYSSNFFSQSCDPLKLLEDESDCVAGQHGGQHGQQYQQWLGTMGRHPKPRPPNVALPLDNEVSILLFKSFMCHFFIAYVYQFWQIDCKLTFLGLPCALPPISTTCHPEHVEQQQEPIHGPDQRA